MNASYIRDIDPWFNECLFVRESNIHGIGLYASNDLACGNDILRFGGFLFHLSERRTSFILPSTTVPLSEEIIIAERIGAMKDPSDYINHSCDPNIGFRDALSVIAIRDIPKGEEIVIDYAFWEADLQWHLRQPCNCGARCCRVQISGRDWQRFTPTDPLFRYLSPFLRRRILTNVNKGGDLTI